MKWLRVLRGKERPMPDKTVGGTPPELTLVRMLAAQAEMLAHQVEKELDQQENRGSSNE